MKLMGVSVLAELVGKRGNEVDGSVAALVAELRAGCWRSMDEMARTFPGAAIDGTRAQITFCEGHRVGVVVDCERQMILIEYARAERGTRAEKTGSKAA